MNLEEALKEIERLNQIISEKDKEIELLRKKKNAGRKKNNAQWQESYNEFVKLYEQGVPMVEIVERSECSRRTCYRYKEYYDKMFRHKTLEERAAEFEGDLMLDGEYDWGEIVEREHW